ncbi:MAG: Uncharacterised protein [Cryomorphaceae bacterium]|nr:MAG: Uncharacterised protein [Cryomorphaceae bacterium]
MDVQKNRCDVQKVQSTDGRRAVQFRSTSNEHAKMSVFQGRCPSVPWKRKRSLVAAFESVIGNKEHMGLVRSIAQEGAQTEVVKTVGGLDDELVFCERSFIDTVQFWRRILHAQMLEMVQSIEIDARVPARSVLERIGSHGLNIQGMGDDLQNAPRNRVFTGYFYSRKKCSHCSSRQLFRRQHELF